MKKADFLPTRMALLNPLSLSSMRLLGSESSCYESWQLKGAEDTLGQTSLRTT
jgi:hypothetical protein